MLAQNYVAQIGCELIATLLLNGEETEMWFHILTLS